MHAARTVVRPTGPYVRTVTVPGSKSLAARALAIAALSPGDSRITGDLSPDDSRVFLEGLRALGVPVGSAEGHAGLCRVSGLPPGRRWNGGGRIDAGASATAARFLAALAAFTSAPVLIDGSERLRQRPMKILFEALKRLGVSVNGRGEPGRLPAEIGGGGLQGGTVRLPASVSSQFFSGLLLAGSRAEGEVRIVPDETEGPMVSRPYVGLTLAVLQAFGVRAGEDAGSYVVVPGEGRATDFTIESDASAASFAFAAAAVTGGETTVRGVSRSSRQPDARFLDVLEELGCAVTERSGDTTVRGGSLRGVRIDLGGSPDSVPPLAAVSLFARGPTEISGVGHLRFKESDRLSALAEGLSRLGARIEEMPGGIRIDPPARPARSVPAATSLDPRGDHRVAMAFAVAGLGIDGVSVQGPECVSKSFPQFWKQVIETEGSSPGPVGRGLPGPDLG